MRLHASIARTPEIAEELERCRRGRAQDADDSKQRLKAGTGDRAYLLRDLLTTGLDLAKFEYAMGRPLEEVRASLEMAAEGSVAYHRLVVERLRADPTSSLRGDPGLWEDAVNILLLLKKEVGIAEMIAAPEEVLRNPNLDPGEESMHALFALRHFLRGDRDAAREELAKAKAKIEGPAWQVYARQVLDKKSKERFAGLTAIEDHPIGALLDRNAGRFNECVRRAAEAFELLCKKMIKRKELNPPYLAATTAWSLYDTAWVALGLREGVQTDVVHYALAHELIVR